MEPYPRQRRRSNRLGRVSLPFPLVREGVWGYLPNLGLVTFGRFGRYPESAHSGTPKPPPGGGLGRGSGEHFRRTFRAQLIDEKCARKVLQTRQSV